MQANCTRIYEMCQAFNMAPHQYLLNDLADDNASTKLAIDWAVFEQYLAVQIERAEKAEDQMKREALRSK